MARISFLSLAEGRSIASIETLILTAPHYRVLPSFRKSNQHWVRNSVKHAVMSPAWVVLFKIADQFSRENYVFVPSEITTKVRHEHEAWEKKFISRVVVCCRMFLGMVCGELREITRMGVYDSPRGIAGRSGREFSSRVILST